RTFDLAISEVTGLFTTGIMLAGNGRKPTQLPLLQRCRYRRVFEPRAARCNGRLHHRLRTFERTGAPGNRRNRPSMMPTQALPEGRTGARATPPLAKPPPRYVTPKAGIEPALSRYEGTEIFTTSVR